MAGEVFGKCGIDRVPKRLLHTRQLRRNGLIRVPQDGLRQCDILRVRSVPVDPQNPVILTDMRLSGATLKARATRQV